MVKQNLILILAAVSLVGTSAFAQNSKLKAPPRKPAQQVVDDIEDDHSGGPEPTTIDPPNYEAPKRLSTAESQEEWKPSATKGEPIFDWSKHKGETEVAHPFAEKGLIKITKDDVYYYKVEESKQSRAINVQVGMINPTLLKNPDATGSAHATFADNYDSASNPAIMLNKEWQLWHTAVGKFGIQAGSGILAAQGHGHFASGINSARTPKEVFTFLAFPNSLGVVYRMQFYHRQLLIPYGAGGAIAMAFTEIRDDSKPPKFGGALDAYAAGGVAFNLTYFDYMSRVQLDREYGIHAVYLTAEYRRIQAITQRYDFSSDYINGGFTMEY